MTQSRSQKLLSQKLMARAVREEFIFESAAYPPTSVNPQAKVHVISGTGN
jgi:hypothetical protein